jgi:hypothetical protein
MASKATNRGRHPGEFPDLVPKTEFGRELLALRARIVASGEPLLDWEGVQREVAERRGGVRHEDE